MKCRSFLIPFLAILSFIPVTYSKEDILKIEKIRLLESREDLFYSLSSGFSRYKGWLFLGMNHNKNFLGLGITNLSFKYSSKGEDLFLIEPGLSYQRNFFLRRTPFIALNFSVPLLNGYFDEDTRKFDGIIITKKGLNVPTLSLVLGYEFRFDIYLIGLEVSERQKISELSGKPNNIQIGASITIPIGG